MANLVRNLDLELPIFSRWTPVAWSSSDIRKRADSSAEKFVRRVTLKYAGATSLRSALEAADATFQRVAEFADIDVVDYRWGLSQRRPSRSARKFDSWRLESDLVPTEYHLVAEVANVSPLVEPPNALWESVRDKINTFNYDQTIPGPKIHEVHTGAVGFREVENEGEIALRGIILDIDPYLRRD